MDRIAQVVGISPVEIRQRNFLKPGQTTITEQVVRDPIDMNKLLDRALELSEYEAKKQRFAEESASAAAKGSTRNSLRREGNAAFLYTALDLPDRVSAI